MSAFTLVVLVFALVALPLCAAQDQLSDFQSIVNALSTGTPVRYVAKYDQCQSDAHPRAIGGSEISTFEFFNDTRFGPQAFFSFSQSVLIANYQVRRSRVLAIGLSRVTRNG
jgi:hypothetical protein